MRAEEEGDAEEGFGRKSCLKEEPGELGGVREALVRWSGVTEAAGDVGTVG